MAGEPTFIETARRQQITSVTIDLVAEHGVARTSLARIAAAAQLSNAAVLYYFKTRDAVIDAAYAQVIAAVTGTVGQAMLAAASGRDAIEAYVRSLIGHMASNPIHMRFVVELLIANSGGMPAAGDSPPRWTPIAEAIIRARDEGDLRSVDERTYAIALGGAINAIFAEALRDPTYDLAGATDSLIELFQRATDNHPAH